MAGALEWAKCLVRRYISAFHLVTESLGIKLIIRRSECCYLGGSWSTKSRASRSQ